MSKLKVLGNEIKKSIGSLASGSLVGLDRTEEDMQNLSEAHGKSLKSSREYIKVTGNPHKISNLVNEISDILAKDKVEENSQNKEKKKAHHVKSKDYLGDKKNRIPSAAELMNGPLRDSYQGLESGEAGSGRGSYRDFSKLTAKDLSKSVNDNLNMTADGGSKEARARKGRRGSVDVKKSSIINSTLASTIEIVEPKDYIAKPLGITGKDLARASKSSLVDISNKVNKKKSSKGSIGAAINEPFKKSMENLGLDDDQTQKPSPVKILPPKNATDMIVATKEHHRNHAHEKI
jgi:hypothetical protein